MARTKKVQIWMKVGTYDAKYLETCKNRTEAEAVVRRYEREDDYQINVEHYGFAHGRPVYEIRNISKESACNV